MHHKTQSNMNDEAVTKTACVTCCVPFPWFSAKMASLCAGCSPDDIASSEAMVQKTKDVARAVENDIAISHNVTNL